MPARTLGFAASLVSRESSRTQEQYFGMENYGKFARTLQDEIARAYRASGNSLGWRFLYSPVHVLDGARVAFIGLNPGGSTKDPDHGEFAMESGSAYQDERWPSSSRLQKQVLELFRRLDVAPEDVLAGNLVPFRSPDWDSLVGREEALSFGLHLCERVLRRAAPPLVITMGRETNDAISRLIRVQDIAQYPINWGRYTASRGQFQDGNWIGLPHLSRFTIMDREASKEALNALFAGVTFR